MPYSQLASRFINIYNELSEYMEEQLHMKDYRSHVQMLNIMSKKNQIIKNYYDELRTFANLRNVIIHDSTSKYNPIAEPHKEVVERYEYILQRLTNPTTAYDIATKASDLVFAHLNMRLIDCIKTMHDKNYSYMPVIEKQKFIGVLSGDSIFTYMRKNHTITIYPDFRVSDLGDSIKEHMDERYSFVSKNTLVDDIIFMYNNDIKDGRRLGAVFVTDTGKKEEKIEGMISAWDLIEYVGRDE
ncbi:MAG: CBS domain-containing protein [Eubacteriales bacterium]